MAATSRRLAVPRLTMVMQTTKKSSRFQPLLR